MTTVAAPAFLNGIGIVYTGRGNPDLEIRHLAKHGIKRIRLEIGWGSLDYGTESQIANADRIAAVLSACRRYHVRPLILLNGNAGVPCPCEMFNRTLASGASAGAKSVTLTDASGLRPGYSGLSNLTGYIAAESFVTSIAGDTVTLSKPLPHAIGAGASVPMATLKYRPFSTPGSEESQAALRGWRRYVAVVGAFAKSHTAISPADAGYDLEVWNELTFGSQFLSIRNYEPAAANPDARADDSAVYRDLLVATADEAAAYPQIFAGVRIADGFASTIPWPAASTEPARIVAISKHPYRGRSSFPSAKIPGTPLNALYQPDHSGWEPRYTAYFPEFPDTMIQTESLMRDLSPVTSQIYGIKHGTRSRPGRVTPLWITEAGMAPDEDDPAIDGRAAMRLKAKTTLRYYAFYLGQGAGLVTLYNDTGGDRGFGLVSDAFFKYSDRLGAAYPADDTSLTSPALAAVGAMAQAMSKDIDLYIGTPGEPLRAVKLLSASGDKRRIQFPGDGTTAHPPLYDSDVFAFLPVQVNPHRFAIAYYVMTRDVRHVYNHSATDGRQYDMPEETFRLSVSGINHKGLHLECYDPICNTTSRVESAAATGPNSFSVKVSAVDYPRILILQELVKHSSL